MCIRDRIYLSRELFPVSSLWVAFVHFVPQLAVLLLGALVVGWRPTMLNVMAGLLSIAMVAIFALGLGPVSYTHLDVYKRQA